MNPEGVERVYLMAYGLKIFRKSKPFLPNCTKIPKSEAVECRRPSTDLEIHRRTNLSFTLGSANIPLDSLSFHVPSKSFFARLVQRSKLTIPITRHDAATQTLKQIIHSFFLLVKLHKFPQP